MTPSRSVRRAFTLIELLVVIAIIAILAAILFPVFAQAKQAAKKTVSMSNQKQNGTGVMLYLSDNDDVLVPLRFFDTNDGLKSQYASAQGFYHYPLLLQPYTKSTDIFLDPNDREDDPEMHYPTCPASGRFDKNGCAYWYLMGAYPSYGFNSTYLNSFTQASPMSTKVYYGKSATAFEASAETLLFVEATGKDVTSPGRPVVRAAVGYHRVDPPTLWRPLASADPAARGVDARTQGQIWGRYDPKSVIVTWLDGHAKFTPISRLNPGGTTDEAKDRFFNGLGSSVAQ